MLTLVLFSIAGLVGQRVFPLWQKKGIITHLEEIQDFCYWCSEKLILARLGVSRTIYLGFPYFNFLGGHQSKETPCMFTFVQAGWQHRGFLVATQKGSNPRRSAKRPKMCTKCTCKISFVVVWLFPVCTIHPLLIQSVNQVTVDVRGEWVGGASLLLILLLLLLLPLLSILGKVNPLFCDHPCLVVIIFVILSWPKLVITWSCWRSYLPRYRNTGHTPRQWNSPMALL